MELNLNKTFTEYVVEWDEEIFVAIIPLRFKDKKRFASNLQVLVNYDFSYKKVSFELLEEDEGGSYESEHELHIGEELWLKGILMELLNLSVYSPKIKRADIVKSAM